MKTETIKQLVGADSSVAGTLHVYADFGDGPEELGRAPSIGDALNLMMERLFGGEAPDYDDSILDELPVLENEPLLVRALVYELSDAMLIDRIVEPADLAYLRPVLEENSTLRLVVAWEASSPRQDFAVGIFREA